MDCDYDPPSAYNEKVRKARKAHLCGDCRGDIKPGERYLYMSGIWEGKPENFSRCMDCQHLRCEIKRDTQDDACMFIGGLYTWLCECYPEEDRLARRWIAMFNTYAPLRNSKRKIPCHSLATALANLYPEESDPGSRLGATPVSASPTDSNPSTR